MKRIFLAAFAAFAVATNMVGMTMTVASAHYPGSIWSNGYQYWRASHYDSRYCIYHHDYVYCRRASAY